MEKKKKEVLELTVNYNSITDFLRQRLKIPKNWSEELFKIQSKLQQLRSQLPQENFQSIRTFLKDFNDIPLSYTQIQKILQMLLQLPIAKDKNLFGNYKNQTVLNWSKIAQQIKKQNLFIPHAATNLVKIIDYQISSRRKNIKSNQRTIQQARVKLEGFQNARNKARNQFEKVCSTTHNIEDAQNLSDQHIRIKLYKDIEVILQDERVSLWLKYFDQYIQYFGMGDDTNKKELKFIRYMNRVGNTTIKYLNFYKGKKIQQQVPEDVKEVQEKKYQIYQEQEEQGLEQEILVVNFGEQYNFQMVDEQGKKQHEERLEQKEKEKISQLTILGYQQTRKILINQLYESKYFLESRIYELLPARDPQNFMIYQQARANKPQILLKQTQELLKGFLNPIVNALQLLESKQIKYLHTLHKDRRHSEEKVNKIMSIRATQRKHEKKLSELTSRCENLRTQLIQMKKQYDFLKTYSEELIERMERDMSNVFGLTIRILT